MSRRMRANEGNKPAFLFCAYEEGSFPLRVGPL